MTDNEKFELLVKFIAVLSESTYKANAVAQTAVQLLIKKNIVTYDEAAEMRKVVEDNTVSLKCLRLAITLFDKKIEELRESDAKLKEIMNKVANGDASYSDLFQFIGGFDE